MHVRTIFLAAACGLAATPAIAQTIVITAARPIDLAGLTLLPGVVVESTIAGVR